MSLHLPTTAWRSMCACVRCGAARHPPARAKCIVCDWLLMCTGIPVNGLRILISKSLSSAVKARWMI